MKIMHRLDASYPDFSARTVHSVRIVRRAFFLCALLLMPQAFSADISGIWKHAKEPGWIEI